MVLICGCGWCVRAEAMVSGGAGARAGGAGWAGPGSWPESGRESVCPCSAKNGFDVVIFLAGPTSLPSAERTWETWGTWDRF